MDHQSKQLAFRVTESRGRMLDALWAIYPYLEGDYVGSLDYALTVSVHDAFNTKPKSVTLETHEKPQVNAESLEDFDDCPDIIDPPPKPTTMDYSDDSIF